jgi:hypothetical protein
MTRPHLFSLLLCPALLHPGLLAAAQTNTLDRPYDPVVLTGQDLPALLSVMPSNIVAFHYRGGWEQVPVQVDERLVIDYGFIYNLWPTNFASLVYADPGTYVGADTNALFDADDELVFMAQDAGDRAPANACFPGGTITNSPLELTITDPLTSGTGYVYLFCSDGSLDPGAGRSYVQYQFTLLAGTYLTNYNVLAGPNPENSIASNAWYRTHFSDRWIRDELNIYAGSATGVDILDRHKDMFGPGLCQRTENTFSAGEGAFIVNKSGPVRAIRSYVGANSGPMTQRDHFFYERRQDIVTYLRVHEIPGLIDLYDYSTNAIGMVYYDNLNTGGVTIDGMNDAITPGPITWEMVTGPQGTLITVSSLLTDITPFAYTSYYSDNRKPVVTQCTGDAYEFGTSGPWIDQTIPTTDPLHSSTNHLTAVRVDYYDAPGQAVGTAQLRQLQASNPLHVSVAVFQGDSDCDGMADAWELFYFGSLARDGTGNADQDGVLDLGEYIAGTNPTNSASLPLLAIALSGGQPAVSFTALGAQGVGYTGLSRYYSLETKTNLAPGNWMGVAGYTNLLATNQVVNYPVPTDAPVRFYRMRIELR